MTTWNSRTVRAAARRAGVVIEMEGDRYGTRVSAIAPKGFVFGESGCHVEGTSTERVSDAWRLIGEQLEWGLEPCTCQECTA